MEKSFETKYGTVLLRKTMLDVNGTDLIEGVEIKIDDRLAGEIPERFIDLDELTIKEVEEFVEKNCDFY